MPRTTVSSARSPFRVGKVQAYQRGRTWYLCYHENGKRRRPRVGPDREQARQLAAQTNAQLEGRTPTALGFQPITLPDLQRCWLDHHEHVLRSSLATVNRYRTATDHLLNFVREVRPLRQAAHFSAPDAEAFVCYLRNIEVAPNGCQGAKKRKLLDQGVKYIVHCCGTLFNYAAKRRHLPPYAENAFSALRIDRMPVEDAKEIVVFTAEQEGQFVRACDGWQFPVFVTLMLTGLRPGELCHLLVEDVDWEGIEPVLRVRNKRKLGWQIKTRNERDIPLVPVLQRMLKAVVGDRRHGPFFVRPGCCYAEHRSQGELETALNEQIGIDERIRGRTLSRKERHAAAKSLWWSTLSADQWSALTVGQWATLPLDPPATGSIVSSLSYGYDAANNRISMSDGTTSTTYAYTDANQLTAATAVAGLSSVVTTYVNDMAGNRLSVQSPGGITYYAFDAAGRMSSAEPPAGVVSFDYNADGQRTAKHAPGGTAGFLYDFKNLLQETEGVGGAVDTTYTTLSDEYGEVLSEGDSTEELYHQYDGQWGTNVLSDDSTVAGLGYRYQAFGPPDPAAAIDTDSSFMAFGQKQYYLDPEIELYLLGGGGNAAGRGRYYDPGTGRFTAEDPLRHAAGDNNLHRYVGNDPVNNADASGLVDKAQVRGKVAWALKDLGNLYRELETFGKMSSYNATDESLELQALAIERATDGYVNTHHILNNEARQFASEITYWTEERGAVMAEVIRLPDDPAGIKLSRAQTKTVADDGRALVDEMERAVDRASILLKTAEVTKETLEWIAIAGGVAVLAEQAATKGAAYVCKRVVQVMAENVAISAANRYVVNPIAEKLGIDPRWIQAGMVAYQTWSLFKGICFAAGTLVHTELGLVPIECVEAGMGVWSYDLIRGEWELCNVRARLDRLYDGEIADLQIGDDLVTATAGHPFWVDSGADLAGRPTVEELPHGSSSQRQRGRWVRAQDLQQGDTLLGHNGSRTKVGRIRLRDDSLPVYNLTVDGSHTYAVSRVGVLVHNMARCGGAKKPAVGDEHHLMTNKNKVSKAAGGPYTPEFERLAARRGITLDDAVNKMHLPGHQGPHPEYNRVVYERLRNATNGRSGQGFNKAFDAALSQIRTETATLGTSLNDLATGK